MSKSRLSGRAALITIGVVLVAVIAGGTVWALNAQSGVPEGFVYREGRQFMLDGEPFHAAGSNNYHAGFAARPVQDRIMRTVAENDFEILRIWGFNDIGDPADPRTTNDVQNVHVYFQYWDPELGRPVQNESERNGLVFLDNAIASAAEHGVKLVIPFVNNWAPFGGMGQYVMWADLDTHGSFYTDEQIKQWYKDWMHYLLHRENTVTGVVYKDDPTIAVWELANEARCDSNRFDSGDCSDETITPWAQEMAEYFKSLNSNHLLGFGDEGFMCEQETGHWTYTCATGQDSRGVSSIEEIDMVGLHIYPDHWDTDAPWATQWIKDHISLAEELDKPVFIGEYGWRGDEPRNVVFNEWMTAFQEGGGGIALYWVLQPRDETGATPDFDGFTVYCPSPVCLQTSYRSQSLNTGSTDFPPVSDNDVVSVGAGGSAELDLLANDVSMFSEIDPATVSLDPDAGAPVTSLSTDGVEISVSDGVLSVEVAEDASGRVELKYTVADIEGRVGEPASIVVRITGG